MVSVLPAIIPQSFDDLSAKLARVKDYTDLVQVDVMDGVFAPSTSWPYEDKEDRHFRALVSLEEIFPFREDVQFEVDMMVAKPEEHIDDWMSVGASACIIHFESTDVLQEIIERLHERHVGVGLALKPSTPNDAIESYLEQIDFVQCMGNDRIGYHGVELDKGVLGKVKDLRIRAPELIIGVDIGVTFETASALVEAGVSKLISGSTIFNSDDVRDAIERLRRA